MVYFPLAYFLTVGAKTAKDSFHVVMEVTPVRITRSTPNAMPVVLNPTLRVSSTDIYYPIRLGTTVNPVHSLLVFLVDWILFWIALVPH